MGHVGWGIGSGTAVDCWICDRMRTKNYVLTLCVILFLILCKYCDNLILIVIFSEKKRKKKEEEKKWFSMHEGQGLVIAGVESG